MAAGTRAVEGRTRESRRHDTRNCRVSAGLPEPLRAVSKVLVAFKKLMRLHYCGVGVPLSRIFLEYGLEWALDH
jgi:hypothetical protein